MATRNRNDVLITLRDSSTGELLTSTQTVKFCPTDGSYPDDAIDAIQLANLATYKPASDLDDTKDYWVYVNGMKKYRIVALN